MLDPQGVVDFARVHRPKMKECSAVLVYDPERVDGGFELINWEIPEDTDDHHLDSTIAVLDVSQKAEEYGVIMGAVVGNGFCHLRGRPNANGGGSLEWFPACPDADRPKNASPCTVEWLNCWTHSGLCGPSLDALRLAGGLFVHVFGDDIGNLNSQQMDPAS